VRHLRAVTLFYSRDAQTLAAAHNASRPRRVYLDIEEERAAAFLGDQALTLRVDLMPWPSPRHRIELVGPDRPGTRA
jgi:hypothetical protein